VNRLSGNEQVGLGCRSALLLLAKAAAAATVQNAKSAGEMSETVPVTGIRASLK